MGIIKESFTIQMTTMAGDTLLSAAFLAYAGFFDHHQRQRMNADWCEHLDVVGIPYKEQLSVVEYLSLAAERLQWQANKLPTDELCTENAIILKNFNRYPLIVDPAGQATSFLMQQFSDKSITKTSFLNKSFMKQLESALRFGTCLLLEDVDKIDPILNPVLNKGGSPHGRTAFGSRRRPGYRLFAFIHALYDDSRLIPCQFTPDVCSRVTFVNFTVTPSSLESQCLTKILKMERPDVDKQRSDLLKLQGEYQARLRESSRIRYFKNSTRLRVTFWAMMSLSRRSRSSKRTLLKSRVRRRRRRLLSPRWMQ